MTPHQLPLIVLGGSDRHPALATGTSDDRHPLSGYKAADIEIQGRPLVAIVLERARDSGCFAPVYLAGPARVYDQVVATESLIDTDGSFGHNIQTALEATRRRHPGSPVAFLTSDVVPEVATLRRLAALYAASAPCDLWAPMVRVRADRRALGASTWKPRYRIVFEPGSPAPEALPGHLVVVDPEAIALDRAYAVFQIAY